MLYSSFCQGCFCWLWNEWNQAQRKTRRKNIKNGLCNAGFDKNAVSSVGAKGLTQITPETFQWLQTKTGESYEEDALFEPEISVYYGAYFLNMLLEEFGNTETALAAYHAGRGKVNEWLADPRISPDGEALENIPYEDTAGYVKKVIKVKERYQKIYDIE